MNKRDLQYLWAFSIPLSAYVSLTSGSLLSYFTLLFTFGILPFFELFTPQYTHNFTEEEKKKRVSIVYFDILLFLNIVWNFGLMFLFYKGLVSGEWTWSETIGKTLSIGILQGSNGINVAHELGHKPGLLHQMASRILLWPSLYGHFTTEHNYGHHTKVSTPEDPATSRYGEWLYTFWFRSIIMGYISAWKIKLGMLRSVSGFKKFIGHPLIDFVIWPLLFPVLIYYFFGYYASIASLCIAMISVLLLESINYIEHYGLLRKKTSDTRYEPVEKIHSWNSNHELGRVILYELTRHSDHHYKAFKKYQNLDHFDASPQLPYGYPGSILLALLPPVWFSIMNPRVTTWRNKNL